ncbi:glycogen operon protein [Kineosphaera limosa]|nr:glycogen debranching protein GlgX [Kineosphaera limosa]NYD99545.1 glycogen operon protein [Kineosphaera limosa]
MASAPDLPPPLGAFVDDDGCTFAIMAAHATGVELCLFGDHETDGPQRIVPMTDRIHGVWFVHVPGVQAGQRYGYRVHGPWRPDQGQRHNPAKLLVDPYARAIEGDVAWVPQVYGHVVNESFSGDPAVRDDRDSAPFVPRSVVVDNDFDWGPHEQPVEERRVPWPETVIYETHVRGATKLMPGVPEHLRGTYAGMAHPAFIEHLLGLGVTTVELLPVHYFVDEPALAHRGMSNSWGYNTLGFFAPQIRYSAAPDALGALTEFKELVRALHAAGLEVILDVVFNHTAEQSTSGAMLSFRGIDQGTYYRLDERGHDIDVTGCGNTVNTRHPTPLRLVMDSLRYWVEECHVDGFRFDLAVALARGRTDEYDRDHPLLMALRTSPVLSRVKLIAEPWDVGMHGWRTGQFPPPFGEWNDRFRDTSRSFWLADVAVPAHHGHGVRELATRLAGSQDLFGTDDRGPLASINYVASHDGFTLADACSYQQKHNHANGEDNRDGHGDNRSFNHGVEGPTDDEEVLANRRRSMRNLLATTLLSTGTPMILAGDEFGRTQRGNNNAYNQDNAISWTDWDLEPWQEDLQATTAYLIGLRRTYRVLRQATFFSSHPRPGDGRVDLLWFGRRGERMTWESWEDPASRTLQMLLLGEDVHGDSLLLVLQGKPTKSVLHLPIQEGSDHSYELIWDSTWERPDPAGGGVVSAGQPVTLGPTSVQIYRVR